MKFEVICPCSLEEGEATKSLPCLDHFLASPQSIPHAQFFPFLDNLDKETFGPGLERSGETCSSGLFWTGAWETKGHHTIGGLS